jgi:type IV secretion system protein VirB10
VGTAASHEATGSPGDPLAGNPYSAQYRQADGADLDAGAPHLRSNELRRMNRHALFLLGAVLLLLLCVVYWMITSTATREPTKPREEKVTVPEAPRPLAMPRPPSQAAPSEPIPLVRAVPAMPSQQPASAPSVHEPTLLQRRIAASSNALAVDQQAVAAEQAIQATAKPGQPDGPGPASAQPLIHADTLMQRGTYIRCVLETRIISDIPGYTSCLVTEPVYSFTGRKLLLPKGSKVLGTYDMQPNVRRMAVIWDRIITPTGIDVNMASPGIDNLGGAGLLGHYDAHWASRIGSALLISMLSDAFKYEAAEHGPRTTTISNGFVTQEPFESNTAQTVQNLANQVVQASANRPATVTINQGTVIYVYVAKDVDFSGVVARF